MTAKIDYHETDSFKRDLKILRKKFKTLIEDIETAKRNAIELLHLNNIDNGSLVLIPGYNHANFQFYKLRKFACRALKGRGSKSGIRIIYAYDPNLKKVTFIEIYFKADQANEDQGKIKAFLSCKIGD